MRITATDKRLKVAFRKPGRYYGQNRGEGEVFDDGDRTSYPFDEVDVEQGQSWELPEGGTLVFVREYLPVPDFTFDNIYVGGA